MDDDYQDLKTLYLTEIFASKFVWSVVQLSSHVQWFFPEKNNPSSASWKYELVGPQEVK